MNPMNQTRMKLSHEEETALKRAVLEYKEVTELIALSIDAVFRDDTPTTLRDEPCIVYSVHFSWEDGDNRPNRDIVDIVVPLVTGLLGKSEFLCDVIEHIERGEQLGLKQHSVETRRESVHRLPPDLERDYLSSLQEGELVVETCATSCMYGRRGVVAGLHSVKWDPSTGEIGQMTTSVTHGTRRLYDFMLNTLRDFEHTMIRQGSESYPFLGGSDAKRLLRDVQLAIAAARGKPLG